jgi:hypothetical protein
VAYGTSSPRTEAHDYSSVLHVGRGTVTADEHVTVRISGEVTVTGGALTQRVPLTTEPATVRGMYARVLANPEEHDQSAWARRTACGVKYCAAGHALLEVGAVMNIDDETVEVASLPERFRSRFSREFITIRLGAKTVLGLDESTAERLFSGSNSIEGLGELVDEICAGIEPEPVAGASE